MDIFRLFGVIGLKGVSDVKKQLNEVTNNAEKSSSKLSKLGGFAKGLGKGVLVATGAVAAGGVALIKNVSSSYGALQQSIGGIETLFKDSAKKVIDNANNAYTTAGISANEYMQQVTSFSASLLQSLGGDTEKAADAADMAVRDMADNANKMGTSMEMIQNAYQGFSKQNYTMLDNLKLGYGGTKTEMQRLLKDAQKISGIKYDISNLNDVYSAIHVIQGELGITGTTAEEAGETIEGSFNSLNASWQNFIAGLGDPNADMSKIVDNLAKGISGAVNNVTPIIENMVQVLPTVMDAIINAISQMLPTLIKTFTELITQVINAIVQLLPQFIPLAVDCVMTVVNALLENLPLIVEAALQLVLALAMGIAQALPELMPTIITVIEEIINILLENIDVIIDAGIQLLLGLIQGLVVAIPMLVDYIPVIIEKIIETLMANIFPIMEAGIQILVALINGIVQVFPKIFTISVKIIWSIIKGLLDGLPDLMKTGGQMIGAIVKGIINTIGNVIKVSMNIKKGIENAFKNLPKFFRDVFVSVWNAIKSPINGIIAMINVVIDALNGLSFDVPDWVPGIGGSKFGFNLSKINYLAKGGVMTRPTILDYNPQSNSATIAGEAGAEAIAPISVLQNYIESAVAKQTGGLSESIDRLYDLINGYMPKIVDNMDKNIVLDTNKLVGNTINAIDRQLGNRTMRKVRGNV